MPLGHSFQITGPELEEIFNRLQPYLPKQLKKVEPHPRGVGLHFDFAPFTGREPQPSRPAVHSDPKLAFVREDDDQAEHLLREKARFVLDDVYDQARAEWRNAAYVAALKTAIGDAPGRWKTYQQELKALEAAYAYLRSSEAAAEWPAALSRLIDAQDRAQSAAAAFDERAGRIAYVHDEHLYAELSHREAMAAVGHPEADEWHIAAADQYGHSHYTTWDNHPPLAEVVRRLIEQQDAHVAKIGRLSGTAD